MAINLSSLLFFCLLKIRQRAWRTRQVTNDSSSLPPVQVLRQALDYLSHTEFSVIKDALEDRYQDPHELMVPTTACKLLLWASLIKLKIAHQIGLKV